MHGRAQGLFILYYIPLAGHGRNILVILTILIMTRSGKINHLSMQNAGMYIAIQCIISGLGFFDHILS